jgi:hypothetical protein
MTLLELECRQPCTNLVERRCERSIALLRQQSTIGLVVALRALWCVLGPVWKLWVCDAEISGHVKLTVLAKAPHDVRKLLVVRRRSAILRKLRDVTNSISPTSIYYDSFTAKQCPALRGG